MHREGNKPQRKIWNFAFYLKGHKKAYVLYYWYFQHGVETGKIRHKGISCIINDSDHCFLRQVKEAYFLVFAVWLREKKSFRDLCFDTHPSIYVEQPNPRGRGKIKEVYVRRTEGALWVWPTVGGPLTRTIDMFLAISTMILCLCFQPLSQRESPSFFCATEMNNDREWSNFFHFAFRVGFIWSANWEQNQISLKRC